MFAHFLACSQCFRVTNNSFFKTRTDIWKNKNESMNKTQSCDLEMIRDEKRGEVEEEIRLQVDALMREELDLLKIVSCIAKCWGIIITVYLNSTFIFFFREL